MSKSYHQYNVKLEEAMTIDLTQSVRVWTIQGLHVQGEEIPDNANIQTTFVIKFPEGRINLVIYGTVEGDLRTYMGTIAEVSTLEELKDQFHRLFELEGSLYAFA